MFGAVPIAATDGTDMSTVGVVWTNSRRLAFATLPTLKGLTNLVALPVLGVPRPISLRLRFVPNLWRFGWTFVAQLAQDTLARLRHVRSLDVPVHVRVQRVCLG